MFFLTRFSINMVIQKAASATIVNTSAKYGARITSYNVCYTKLLRFKPQIKQAEADLESQKLNETI